MSNGRMVRPVVLTIGLACGACDSITIEFPDRKDWIIFTGRITNEFDSGIRHANAWVQRRDGDCRGSLARPSAQFGVRSQHDGAYELQVIWATRESRCYTLTAVVGGRRPFDVDVWARAGDSVTMNIVVPESWGR